MQTPPLSAVALCLIFAGCIETTAPAEPAPPTLALGEHVTNDYTTPQPDDPRSRGATLRVLFIGNSHTLGHQLPELVCRMIEFAKPEERVFGHVIPVAFLDDVAKHPGALKQIDSGHWDIVVLQAQKISTSGKYDYPRDAGIDLAKRAAKHGSKVYFFAEWGIKGDATSGPRHERIYREMADASGANVIAVGRAWDLALAERADLALHESDRNHETKLGAFLTACVIAGQLADVDAASFGEFPTEAGDVETREFLAAAAARSFLKINSSDTADDKQGAAR